MKLIRRFVDGVGWMLLLLLASPAQAQLLPARADSLDSHVLGQKRAIEVYLPVESQKNPAQRYETLYVLDGDWNSQVVVQTVSFLRQVGFIPPIIVVSVLNVIDANGNSRDHDLTPSAVADHPHSGGAAGFLAFLKTELLPHVERRYPANGTRLIHGHSFGGLFLMYVLAEDPSLFDGYLILDPSLWWNQYALIATLDQHLADVPAKGKAIYIAARDGEAFTEMGIAKLEPTFRDKAPPDLHLRVKAYGGESHDSLKFKGTYDALKFAYAGYSDSVRELVPYAGIVADGQPVYIDAGNWARFDLRYTTDGSMPDASSPNVENVVAVTDPERTTIKVLSTRGLYDRVLAHHLKRGAPLRPSRTAGADTRQWHVALYAPQAWPNLRRSKPFKTLAGDAHINFDALGSDAFAGVVERNLEIPGDGYYVISVGAANKARVSLAGVAVIDHDGSEGERERAYIVPLRRGTYAMRLEFQHPAKGAGANFILFRCLPGERACWKNEMLKLAD